MSQNQQLIPEQDWSGPFKANVNHDRSASDGCNSLINNHTAFKPYSDKEKVKVKVYYDSTTVKFETHINYGGHSKSASFPIEERKKLGVKPEDEMVFWVKSVENDSGKQRVAIKPGSSVYHHVSESGEILCNHGGATKPGTSDSGLMIANLETEAGEWSVCSVCENLNGPTKITHKNAIKVVRKINGLERNSKAFNKSELMQIAQNTAQTKKDYKEAIESVVSDE